MRRFLAFALLAATSLVAAETKGVAPAVALERLKAGNAAYVAGKLDVSHINAARRAEVAGSQSPFAIVLTCADSRVPAEAIFNVGIGDIFVIRVAGAVADPAVLGSIEYAAEHLHTRLLVVLGHTSCGAVKAAMGGPGPAKPTEEQANLESILVRLRAGLARAEPAEGESAKWLKGVEADVRQTLEDVEERSPVLKEMMHKGEVEMVGAVYELATGKVRFFDNAKKHVLAKSN